MQYLTVALSTYQKHHNSVIGKLVKEDTIGKEVEIGGGVYMITE